MEDAESATSIESRLISLNKSLNERLDARDGTISLLRELGTSLQRQNESLDKQITTRWNWMLFISSFIPIAFTTAFVYQLYNVEKVNSLQKDLEQKTNELNIGASQFSSVLENLASADQMSTDAYREFLRNDFEDAAYLSSIAIDKLRDALAVNNIQENSFRPFQISWDYCEPLSVPTPDEKMSATLTPKSLQSSVINALFAAHDLKAKSLFFAQKKFSDASLDKLLEEGEILLGLKPNSWEGYHWLGLSQLDRQSDSNLDGSKTSFRSKAFTCFNQSVSRHPDRNRDWINLSELEVQDGKYQEAMYYAKRFLFPDENDASGDTVTFNSPVEGIAYLYLLISEQQMKTRSAEEIKKRTQAFVAQVAALDTDFSNTFQPGTLDAISKKSDMVSNSLFLPMYKCIKDKNSCRNTLPK